MYFLYLTGDRILQKPFVTHENYIPVALYPVSIGCILILGRIPTPGPPKEGAILKDTLAVYARYAQGASAAPAPAGAPRVSPGFRGGEQEKPGIFCPETGQNIPKPLIILPLPEPGRGLGG